MAGKALKGLLKGAQAARILERGQDLAREDDGREAAAQQIPRPNQPSAAAMRLTLELGAALETPGQEGLDAAREAAWERGGRADPEDVYMAVALLDVPSSVQASVAQAYTRAMFERVGIGEVQKIVREMDSGPLGSFVQAWREFIDRNQGEPMKQRWLLEAAEDAAEAASRRRAQAQLRAGTMVFE